MALATPCPSRLSGCWYVKGSRHAPFGLLLPNVNLLIRRISTSKALARHLSRRSRGTSQSARAARLSKALARHLPKGMSMRLPSSEDPISNGCIARTTVSPSSNFLLSAVTDVVSAFPSAERPISDLVLALMSVGKAVLYV
jgi:hypothetical protein